MPTNNKKSTRIDLSALLEKLLESNVEFILVGGLAAVIQGAPITTMDADIVHKQSSDNISKLMILLNSIDAIHRRPDSKVIQVKKRDISGKGHALFTTKLGPLDVLAMIEEGRSYEDLLEYTVEIEFKGHRIQVLGLKMLVELKKLSRDPKDKLRLPVLEETLRQIQAEDS